MRPLFIHSDNTSLLNKIDQSWWDTEKFVITDYADIDFQLHDFIVNKIANKIPSAIFIKLALSDNYLEFIGLMLILPKNLLMDKQLCSFPFTNLSAIA